VYGWVIYCLKNYAVFRGRAARPEYWWFYLVTFVGNLGVNYGVPAHSAVQLFLQIGWLALTAIPSLAVTSRRLHDTGHSFVWGLAPFFAIAPVVLVGLLNPDLAKQRTGSFLGVVLLALVLAFFVLVIRLFIWLCRKGDEASNRYGVPAPAEPS
jgi:uncharacterized membrane protein YhaH (DUF805 family)